MLKRVLNKAKRVFAEPVKTIDDEYLAWLTFANAGMLEKGNVYCIDYVAQHINSDNPVIEIGSFCGLSTNIISYLLNKYNKSNKIITSDKWIFESAENGGQLNEFSDLTHDQYREFVMDSFKKNVNFFSKNNLPYPIEVFSDEFFELWEKQSVEKDIFNREIKLGGKISFVFIDGNHTYEYAKRDFENTDKFLEVGGFVLFDDSFDGTPFTCGELMKEILKDSRYELVLKNPNYLFKKIK